MKEKADASHIGLGAGSGSGKLSQKNNPSSGRTLGFTNKADDIDPVGQSFAV